MFSELAPLLNKRSLTLILTGQKDGTIIVNLIPKATEDDKDLDKASLTPLTVRGTSGELDAHLPAALANYTETFVTITEAVEATKQEMVAAKAEEEKKRKEKAGNKPAPKPAPAAKDAKPAPAGPPSLFDAQPSAEPTPTEDAQEEPVSEGDDDNAEKTESDGDDF